MLAVVDPGRVDARHGVAGYIDRGGGRPGRVVDVVLVEVDRVVLIRPLAIAVGGETPPAGTGTARAGAPMITPCARSRSIQQAPTGHLEAEAPVCKHPSRAVALEQALDGIGLEG